MKRLIFIWMAMAVGLGSYRMVHAQLKFPAHKPKQLQEHLKLILEPQKSEYALGQPIDLRLRMKSILKEPITIVRPRVDYDLYGWHLSGEISTPDHQRKTLRAASRQAKVIDPAKEDVIQLKPGEEIVLTIRFENEVDWNRESEPWEFWTLGNEPLKGSLLKECFSFPGEYTLRMILDRYMEFIELKGGGEKRRMSAWRGKVSSNELKIKVVEEK